MTAPIAGATNEFLRTEPQAVEHTHALLKAKGDPKPMDQELSGTEVEMFCVDKRDSNPITQKNYSILFHKLQHAFSAQGYDAQLHFERSVNGRQRVITSLHIQDIGVVSTEAGLQFEAAIIAGRTNEHIRDKNEIILATIIDIAKSMDHQIRFEGHRANYAEATMGSPVSRGIGWTESYNECFGQKAILARNYQHATASTQCTLDAYNADLVPKLQIGLIAGPLLALYYNDQSSKRLSMLREQYGKLIPEQVDPILELWNTKTTEQALTLIVNRVMDIPVMMLPDPDEGGYKKVQKGWRQQQPTVRDLMYDGKLSLLNFNNCFPFLYGEPAYRNPIKGTIEMRYVDSMGDPAKVAEFNGRLRKLFYDPSIREEVLNHFRFMDPDRLDHLHWAAARNNYGMMLNGKRVSDMVEYLIEISQPEKLGPTSLRPYAERFVAVDVAKANNPRQSRGIGGEPLKAG